MAMIENNQARFIHAWKRFQDSNIVEDNAEKYTRQLLQYLQLAKKLQHQEGKDKDASNSIPSQVSSDFASVVEELENLTAKYHVTSTHIFRLRSSEFDIPLEKQQKENLVANMVQESSNLDINQQQPNEQPLEVTESEIASMMESDEVPSEETKQLGLRKRLGLKSRNSESRGQHTASQNATREEQDLIQSDMANLAKQLKERTQTINQSLIDDNKMLDAVGQSAETNTALLEREQLALKKQLASSIGLWTSLWLVGVAVLVFIFMYLYMKLFSRRF